MSGSIIQLGCVPDLCQIGQSSVGPGGPLAVTIEPGNVFPGGLGAGAIVTGRPAGAVGAAAARYSILAQAGCRCGVAIREAGHWVQIR
jgi:hypothetical protein